MLFRSVTGLRSVVLGGSAITGSTNDTVYVPYLNLNYVPTNNDSNTEILTRNSTTGNIEYRNASSLGGGGGSSGDTYVTGFTYNNQNKLTISQNGGQPDLNVYINNFSGLTVNGNLSATNITGDTISTTLKSGLFLLTTPQNNNSATQILSRNSTTGVVEYRDTSSFPDTYVTGFTYSNNNLVISRNQGQSNLTVNISTMTGLTVNGSLVVSGNPGTTPVTIVGSGSTILNVQGSSGQIGRAHV